MSDKRGESVKSVTFNPNIHFISSSTETPKKEATIAELLRVIDNTISKFYQKNEDKDYLNNLKSKSSDLLDRLKTILPENVILPNVIEFIIFVIKKYYTGFNGFYGMKSNSGISIFFYMMSNSREERSILLYCLDYLFGINNEDSRIILNQISHYTKDELHSKNIRYSIGKIETFETYSAADIILLIFSKDSNFAKLRINIECEVAYRISDRILCSDFTMGGLLNLSVEKKLVENTLVKTSVEKTGEKNVKDIVEGVVLNTDENNYFLLGFMTAIFANYENTYENNDSLLGFMTAIFANDENTDEKIVVKITVRDTSNENKGFVKPILILVCVVSVLISVLHYLAFI